jgi:hypothetical protein
VKWEIVSSKPSSVASNIRSSVTGNAADPDEPGPGFYKVDGKDMQDLVRTRAATAKFGKDTNRSTFMTILPFPGPGTYDQHIPQSQKDSPKVTFGQKDRSQNPKARFCTKLYISSLHTADQLSCGTPGPGAYQHHTVGLVVSHTACPYLIPLLYRCEKNTWFQPWNLYKVKKVKN